MSEIDRRKLSVRQRLDLIEQKQDKILEETSLIRGALVELVEILEGRNRNEK